MKPIDQLVAVLVKRDAGALEIAAGQPVRLMTKTGADPLSREPVTAAQIKAILSGFVPPHLAEKVRGGESVSFPYRAPAGPVTVSVEPDSSGGMLVVRPEPASDVTPSAKGRRPSHGGRARVDELLRRLVASGGSDLHLRAGEPPIIRRDGSLARESAEPLGGEGVQAILDSIMGDRERQAHQETGDADFAYEIEGVARFRVNAARDRKGPMAVFRTIPSEIPTCDDVGVPKPVQDLCLLSKGLVVVTGPTGSGKSTTLAAMVDKMNREREDHILTIEDPIEFVHESKKCVVTHRQVGEHTASFKSGLRAALREDPDIILIGELRDLETVAIAIETAETGHLVFGTLHTTTAASTVDRIIDQFPGDRQSQIRVMLAESLRGVVAQTLCRRIGGGRIAAREVLLSTPAVSNLIREGKTFQIPSIMQTGRQHGMSTLNDELIGLVEKKLVEPKEAYKKSVDRSALLTSMQSKGIDTSFVGA